MPRPSSGSTRIPKPLRHELRRAALLERFDQAVDAKVIALLAPSGYGKTTVLAQFARQVKGVVVWVTLTEDAADALVLADLIVRAIQQPQLGWPLEVWHRVRAQTDLLGRLAQALADDFNASAENVTLV